MKYAPIRRLLLAPGRVHLLCCAVVLLACIPLLWPDLGNEEVQETLSAYSGIVILVSFLVSVVFMLLSCTYLALNLRNLRALMQMILWLIPWGLCWGVFTLFAIMADVPPLHELETSDPIQQTDTLYTPDEQMTGPSALTLPISLEHADAAKISEAPNLTLLEEYHEDVLDRFLARSPRWAGIKVDSTFYTRPGHVVAVPATTNEKALGVVHAAFLSLVEGEHLPTGYLILAPGSPFPVQEDEKAATPDIALDLGHRHYLLLAWRGANHGETARKAINATIETIDSQMKPLADEPTEDIIEHLIQGKWEIAGSTPELRLCEPPTQYGTYQAEIHVNPGTAGTLLLHIKDLESGQSLKLFNCPALYSDNPDELFRHDIPGSIPQWMHQSLTGEIAVDFPEISPIFAIRKGQAHQYFGVAFEVWFNPAGNNGTRKLLLRRCYKVQAYEDAPKATTPPPAISTLDDEEEEEEEETEGTEEAVPED